MLQLRLQWGAGTPDELRTLIETHPASLLVEEGPGGGYSYQEDPSEELIL
jgi:hypothetical protein